MSVKEIFYEKNPLLGKMTYELADHARNIANNLDTIKVDGLVEIDDFKSYIKRFYSKSTFIPAPNPLYLTIESRTLADLGEQARLMISAVSSTKDSKTSLADRQQIPILSKVNKELSEFQNEAAQVSVQSEAAISEEHIGSEIGRQISAVNQSQIISSELQAIGEELSKSDADRSKIRTILSSVANKIKSRLFSVPGRVKESTEKLYSATKNMIRNVASAAKEKLYQLLKTISEVLCDFMSNLIGSFFSLLVLIQKIAADKGFKIDKINLEIEAFELKVFMAGPLPLIYPQLKTPKLSADFSPK